MIKDICITPQVFENTHINEVNAIHIEGLLDALCVNGYIVGLNNNDWKKTIKENINNIEDQSIKKDLMRYVEKLQKRNRIAVQPKGDINPGNEKDWLTIADGLNQTREFSSIIETLSFENIKQIKDNLSHTGNKKYSKTEKTFNEILEPLLLYSNEIVIIDPYFDICKKSDTQDYKTTLKILIDMIGNRRGDYGYEKLKITINRSNNNIEESKRIQWKDEIKRLDKQKFDLTINLLEDGKKKMHDRYIISKKLHIGLSVSSGFDIDKGGGRDVEFGVVDYDSLNKILAEVDKNNNHSSYNLKYIITKDNIEKQQYD
jgi:hypothetical protein